MLLHIIARGRIGRGPEAELVERYMKRVTWAQKISELPDTGGRAPVAAEHSRTVLLDEGGEQLSSLEFAKLLEKWRDGGVREARFCLGAADGFTPGEREGADRIIAFGGHIEGRVPLADALELPGTFGIPRDRIAILNGETSTPDQGFLVLS